jgi:predicted phage terminase large subunit-like protein
MQEWISARPTLLVLDDVDVTDSVSNPQIIWDNEKKIKTETIGAMDPLRRKIIFLWNVIQEDGVVPRFMQDVQGSDWRDLFFQPLFSEKGENYRPDVFTDEVVIDLKDTEGKTWWNQNYMLIPSTLGTGIFIRQYFDYFLLSHFEEQSWVLEKSDVRCWLFIDPAFSTNSKSDDAVVILYWQHKITKKRYLIDWYANTSAPSSTISAVISMYNNAIYNWFKPEFISVENVYLNKNQTQFIQLLRDELVRMNIQCPLVMYEPKWKKEQRIKDVLEPVMSQKAVKFNKNISDQNFIFKTEKQFLEFPNWDHDDIIDTITQAEEQLKNRWEVQKKAPIIKRPWNYNPY